MGGLVDLVKNNPKGVGTLTAGLGGITKALGQFQTGSAASAQAAFEASILRNNKLIADTAADQAIEEGRQKAHRKQISVANLIGEQRASFAGRNVVVDQDSALDLLEDAARIGRLDELAIHTNAEREALALRMQGASFELQAQLAERRGDDAFKAGILKSISTLAKTAGKVAEKWNSFSNPNTTSSRPLHRIQIIEEDSEDET